MVLFGIDISHHQGGGFDLARTRREGFDFAIFKATEGSSFVDSRFDRNLRAGRAAELLVAAYHYQRGNVSAAAQVAHVKRVVPRDVPVIPDVETNSGSVALTRDIVNRLRSAGYRVPLSYIPRWYWQQLGSPSLAGLPPLWSSRYPDMNGGYASEIYQRVPASYWNGYGGLKVAILQFTSSSTVAGHTPVDANAYRGTRAQLAALLGGGAQPELEEDDMAPVILPPSNGNAIAVPLSVPRVGKSYSVKAAWLNLAVGYGPVKINKIDFIGFGSRNKKVYLGSVKGFTLHPDVPWARKIPEGTGCVSISYTSDRHFSASIDAQRP